mmetsp:Transcript_51291/g.166304  ORF Transcript_51291/g.166304 Transcript_51291/m.166304 type:complete len:281 (-) Transcript_51291:2643-3485(-)
MVDCSSVSCLSCDRNSARSGASLSLEQPLHEACSARLGGSLGPCDSDAETSDVPTGSTDSCSTRSPAFGPSAPHRDDSTATSGRSWPPSGRPSCWPRLSREAGRTRSSSLPSPSSAPSSRAQPESGGCNWNHFNLPTTLVIPEAYKVSPVLATLRTAPLTDGSFRTFTCGVWTTRNSKPLLGLFLARSKPRSGSSPPPTRRGVRGSAESSPRASLSRRRPKPSSLPCSRTHPLPDGCNSNHSKLPTTFVVPVATSTLPAFTDRNTRLTMAGSLRTLMCGA